MKTLIFLEGGFCAGSTTKSPKPARFLASGLRNGYEVGADLFWMLSTDLTEGSTLKREDLLDIFEDGLDWQKLQSEEKVEADWIWKVVLPKGKRQAYGFKLLGIAPNGKTYHENFSVPKRQVLKAKAENDMRFFIGIDEGDGKETCKVKRAAKSYLEGNFSDKLKKHRSELAKKQLRGEGGRFVKKVK